MKIERLRKSYIVLVLVFMVTIFSIRNKGNDQLVEEKVNKEDYKAVALHISEDGTNYSETDNIPTSGYSINKGKSVCRVYDGTGLMEEAPIDSNTIIEYIDHKINIKGISKRSTRCYLYFDKEKGITIDDIIASSNASSATPDFSKVTTTDEGVFKTSDGMYGGTTYYWRGAATTNHVIFANKCWRIVRINGDKTMRLIYNGDVQSGNACKENGANSSAVIMGSTNAEKYYATSDGKYNNSSYVGWTYSLGSQRTLSGTPSNAKVQTENWYKDTSRGNLTAYESKIADGKYCNDRNTESGNASDWHATGSSFNYAGYKRLYTNKTPTFDCPSGDVYTLKIGAITADEVAFAGGNYNSGNSKYYLYTGQYYWTMSPYVWSGTHARVFCVYLDGHLDYYPVSHYSVGLRPVINFRSDITFKSGSDGTSSNPYVV